MAAGAVAGVSGRQMSSRLRALVDWLSERFDENQRVEAVTTVVQRRMPAASGGPGAIDL